MNIMGMVLSVVRMLSASSKPTVIYRERKGYDALEIITEMLTDYNKLILQYSSEKEG